MQKLCILMTARLHNSQRLGTVHEYNIAGTMAGCYELNHRLRSITAMPMGKMETLTPVKLEPLNRLTPTLSGLIMSTRGAFLPNLVKIVHGGLLGKRVIITFCDFLVSLFFSQTNVENRLLDRFGRIMAQKTQNGARMCLLWVIK